MVNFLIIRGGQSCLMNKEKQTDRKEKKDIKF